MADTPEEINARLLGRVLELERELAERRLERAWAGPICLEGRISAASARLLTRRWWRGQSAWKARLRPRPAELAYMSGCLLARCRARERGCGGWG